jgi:biopolymer transport protein ExbD
MRIEGPRHISRPIALTPLIDVVFLLLMFFMLSTTFAKFGLFGMSGAVREEAAEASGGRQESVPGVLIEVRAGPLVRVNGTTLALAELVPELNSLHETGVTEGIIRIRKDARVQDLLSVLEVARTSKLRSLSLTQ